MATSWAAMKAGNFLLLPYEDLAKDREGTVRQLASFMDVPCTPELAAQICQMTSKESMIDIVTKFDGNQLIFPNVLPCAVQPDNPANPTSLDSPANSAYSARVVGCSPAS
jgi:hypothetical protein